MVEFWGEEGGGLLLRNSGARVEECTFFWNHASYGGALACRSASAVRIERCHFYENDANYGGAIDAGGTSAITIVSCTIRGNITLGGLEEPGYGGGVLLGGDVTMEDCAITGNMAGAGAGVAVMAGAAVLRECTIAGNGPGFNFDGIGGGVLAFDSDLSIERSAVWGNCAPEGATAYAGPGGRITFSCSVHEGAFAGEVVDAGGNIVEDPLFCAPVSCDLASTDEGDYRVRVDSPCVPANHPCGEWVGAEPIGCPATGAPESSGDPRAASLALGPVRPNPVRGSLSADLLLPAAGACLVEILDVQGRRVATLLDRPLGAGTHRLTRALPQGCAAGVYYLAARGPGGTQARAFLALPEGAR
jgi:hypothetical protein